MHVSMVVGHRRISNIRVFSELVRPGNCTTIVDLIDLPEAANNTMFLGIIVNMEDLGIIVNAPQWVPAGRSFSLIIFL